MAIVYATLIVKGLKTIDQVPGLIRSQVEEILAALGCGGRRAPTLHMEVTI